MKTGETVTASLDLVVFETNSTFKQQQHPVAAYQGTLIRCKEPVRVIVWSMVEGRPCRPASKAWHQVDENRRRSLPPQPLPRELTRSTGGVLS